MKDKLIAKQEEYIVYLKRLCGVKSVTSDKFESEISALKSQQEDERIKQEDELFNLEQQLNIKHKDRFYNSIAPNPDKNEPAINQEVKNSEELFKKVYINSVDDLPKDDANYVCKVSGNDKMYVFEGAIIRSYGLSIDWYLIPIHQEAKEVKSPYGENIVIGFDVNKRRTEKEMADTIESVKKSIEVQPSEGVEEIPNCPRCNSSEVKVTHTYYDCFECGKVWEPNHNASQLPKSVTDEYPENFISYLVWDCNWDLSKNADGRMFWTDEDGIEYDIKAMYKYFKA